MPDLDPAIQAVFDATNAGDSAVSGATVVGVQVSGNGYNGGGSFEFDVAGGKMQIRG